MRTVTIDFLVRNKFLFYKNEDTINLIGDNADYKLCFTLDEPRTAMFALFRRDGKEKEYALDEGGSVAVPMWVLKEGAFEVGLTSDGFATAALAVWVTGSIKEESGEPAEEVPKEKIDQLIELVNEIKVGGGSGGSGGSGGVSVTDAAVNGKGELVLTLSDGSTLNAGAVKGEKGEKGEPGQDGAKGEKGDKGEIGDTPPLATELSAASTDSEAASAKCVFEAIKTAVGTALGGSY